MTTLLLSLAMLVVGLSETTLGYSEGMGYSNGTKPLDTISPVAQRTLHESPGCVDSGSSQSCSVQDHFKEEQIDARFDVRVPMKIRSRVMPLAAYVQKHSREVSDCLSGSDDSNSCDESSSSADSHHHNYRASLQPPLEGMDDEEPKA